MKTPALHVLAFHGQFWTGTPGSEWSPNQTDARRFDLSDPADAHEAEELAESTGGRLFPVEENAWRALEYVERFADTNGEPADGDCRELARAMRAALQTATAGQTGAPAPSSLATAARAYMEAVRDCDAYPVPQDSEERAELAGLRATKRDAETDLCAALNALNADAPAVTDPVRDQLVAALRICERALTPSRNDKDLIAADDARAALAAAESATPALPPLLASILTD